jgi:hypothetical protein
MTHIQVFMRQVKRPAQWGYWLMNTSVESLDARICLIICHEVGTERSPARRIPVCDWYILLSVMVISIGRPTKSQTTRTTTLNSASSQHYITRIKVNHQGAISKIIMDRIYSKTKSRKPKSVLCRAKVCYKMDKITILSAADKKM